MADQVSGKPDAGEWAEKLGLGQMEPEDDFHWEFAADPEKVTMLADFQRETLLWAADMFDDCGSGWPEALRRMAESCGRGK